MRGTWVAMMRGYVEVVLNRGEPEKFLNEATAERITLWNISFTPEGKLTFGISIPDFFRLRPLLRRSGCRTRILSRHGLPFKMARIARRKTFAGGMLVFVAALFLLSTLVWEVKIEGGSAIPEESIRQAARAEGIYPFQWSFRLQKASSLSQRLAIHLPDAAWIGVDKQGTSLVITVIDSTKPDKRELESPRDLIAKSDAVVTRVIAENGRPKVERNDRVKKGDVLISGRLGDGAARNKLVVSKGTVMGLVWHEYQISSPLVTQTRGLTGAAQERSYLIIGNRALQVSGYRGQVYSHSQIRTSMEQLRIGKLALPFGTMREYELEVLEAKHQLTSAEAKEAGLRQARVELLAKSGKDASIKAENILHEQSENGKVILRVLFEVEQSIEVERPIL